MNNIVSLFDSQAAKSEDKFFTVDNLAINTKEHGEIPAKRGLFVKGNCINIVSDKYEVHQPNEVYDTFSDVAKKSGLEIVRSITNPANGGLLLSAKYSDCQIVGENHDINMTFYTSHCGRYRTFLTLDLLRMACFNQVPVLFKNHSRHIFAEKHYKNALNFELISKAIESIPASVDAYNEKANRLMDCKLSFDDFLDFYIEQNKIDRDSKQFDTKVDKYSDVYYNAKGQDKIESENAYKAYQAVTFINTHLLKKTAMMNENVITKQSDNSLKLLDGLLQLAA